MLKYIYKPITSFFHTSFICLLVLALCVIISGCSSEDVTMSENAENAENGCLHLISFDSGIDLENKPWIEDEFLNAFCTYWLTWTYDSPDETFRFEAPYFQEMINFDHYSNYLNLLRRNVHELESLEIMGIYRLTESHIVVRMKTHGLDSQGNENITGRRDQWVKADDNWYHVIKNPLVFPSVSDKVLHNTSSLLRG